MVRRQWSDFFESNFRSEEEIKECITFSRNFEPNLETPENARALLFFKTSKQQTWLVRTGRRIYCILDDIRKKEPHINWSEKVEKFNTEPGWQEGIRAYPNEKGHFLIDIGPKHKRWLMSEKLMRPERLEHQIKNLVQAP